MKALIFWGNFILCGFIAVSLAFILAGGFIAENYTDKRVVAPEFFLIMPVWMIGASLTWWYYQKHDLDSMSYIKIILIDLLLWITVPIGLWISFSIL